MLTHAHEDHYGALLDLWPRLKVPVYATPFTRGAARGQARSRAGCARDAGRPSTAGGAFTVGPFNIESIPVAHSIPESNALVDPTPPAPSSTPATGRSIRRRDRAADRRSGLRALGDEGVLALICDSTNAVREGRSPSEDRGREDAGQLIETAKGRVAVTTFASNVARMRAVAEAARAAGREVVVVGRAMERIVAGRARDRLSRRRAGFPQRRDLRPSAAATRSWRCAPAARASRARRLRASPRDDHPDGDARRAATA